HDIRKLFPNRQIIATTHSMSIIETLPADAKVFTVAKDSVETRVRGDFEGQNAVDIHKILYGF
ncbi:MAG: hypothetical protein ACRCWR_02545, partial [Saezia sp.]